MTHDHYDHNAVEIYVAGDTYITPQMSEFSARNFDYAFIPTDGTYTMTVEEASLVSDMIGVKHAVPYHTNSELEFDESVTNKFTARNRLIINA